MKTLRILVVLCFVLGFTSNNANSQPIRTEFTVQITFFLPCLNEWISGPIIAERVTLANLKEGAPQPYSKVQLKYDNAVVIGQTSHLTYTIEYISNSEWAGNGNAGPGAEVGGFVIMLIVRLDGKLIALLPTVLHRTTTPDGDLVVFINDRDVRCF